MELYGNGKAAKEAKSNINKAITDIQGKIKTISDGCDKLIENLTVSIKAAEEANTVE